MILSKNNFIFLPALALTSALALVACNDDTPTPVDSGAADTGTSDSAVSDTGAGDSATADTGTTDGSLLDPEVARCQASAVALAAACPDDGNRTCQAGAYASYCHADALPGEFADALDCLVGESSAASGCRTFSDPSSADTCVAAVYAEVTNAEGDAFIASVIALCPSLAPAPTAATWEPPVYAHTPAQLTEAQACVDDAADCAAAQACLEAGVQAPLATCYL